MYKVTILVVVDSSLDILVDIVFPCVVQNTSRTSWMCSLEIFTGLLTQEISFVRPTNSDWTTWPQFYWAASRQLDHCDSRIGCVTESIVSLVQCCFICHYHHHHHHYHLGLLSTLSTYEIVRRIFHVATNNERVKMSSVWLRLNRVWQTVLGSRAGMTYGSLTKLDFSAVFRYRRWLADRRPDRDEDVAVSSTISAIGRSLVGVNEVHQEAQFVENSWFYRQPV